MAFFTPKKHRVKKILSETEKISSTPMKSEKSNYSKTMSPEEYQKMRCEEEIWLEQHFDLKSIDGINRIPAKNGLRCPITTGVTGQLYYFLRRKAYEFEEEGNMDLAVACMRKSSELAKLDYGDCIQKQELYPLVKILARNGQIEEATAEKEFIDRYCKEQQAKLENKSFQRAVTQTSQSGSDLIIMDAHGAACPECAKFQGRVYSISGKSKKFPKAPEFYHQYGSVHRGCSHIFFPYYDSITDPGLDYTLSVHPLKNKKYGRDIVTFSNRPFVDDRTDEAKAEAEAFRLKRAELESQERYNEEHMIEFEAKRGADARDFFWIRENLPDKCPKTITGYRRMKTQNTKNYQQLKELAAGRGRILGLLPPQVHSEAPVNLPSAPMNYCTQCGNKIRSGYHFCTRCGKRLTDF